MTYRDDDLDLTEDDAALAVVEAVRTAYVSDDLPRVGIQLAAVFANGLPAHPGPARPAAERPVAVGTEKRRRWLPSKALLTGLGATVVAVNLAGVGSAGWLPGPLQTSFEKVTRSIGVDVPAPRGVDRQPGPRGDRPARPGGDPATDRRTGEGIPSSGPTVGGSAESPLAPGQGPPQGDQRVPGQGGTEVPGPAVPGAPSVPTTGPGAAGGPAQSPTPATLPCATTTTSPTTTPPSGPTLPTLPTVPTTVKPPIPGHASGGVPGPSGTLPVTPPDCPR
jgi:hypothetical protein